MIISHAHKYIFFAVPKTATHAIRDALREHMGADAWEQQILFGRNVMPIPTLAIIQHGHISAQQLRPNIPEDMWNNYYKFCFVRNPYDRFVSIFFFLTQNQKISEKNICSEMKSMLSLPSFQSRVVTNPQTNILCDKDGKLAMDYIGRYEDIQSSYDHITRHIGTPSKTLVKKNVTENKVQFSYYDDELRQMVADYYARDFELLGYEK